MLELSPGERRFSVSIFTHVRKQNLMGSSFSTDLYFFFSVGIR